MNHQPLHSESLVVQAVGDGNANDHAAIQRALDQSRDVYVPYGIYKIGGTLHVHSGTRLVAHPLARFVHADGCATRQDDFLLTNANCWNPTTDSKELDRDIEVVGGIWDGNVGGNKRSGDHEYGWSGVMIHFAHITNLTVRDLVLRNSNAYYLRVGWAKNIVVERIQLQATRTSPNQDGIHLGGHCEDARIEEIVAHGLSTPDDDMVALNADDAIFRPECNGVPCGPIRRVRVRHLRADDCHSFVRLASVDHEISDVEIDDVVGGCQVCAVNVDALRYCRTPIFKDSDPGRENGVGSLRNVRLSRFTVHKSAPLGHALLRLESRMPSLVLRDFRRDRSRDVAPDTPTLRIKHVAADVSIRQADQPTVVQRIDVNDTLESQTDAIAELRVRGID
jgi:hypothetical protein